MNDSRKNAVGAALAVAGILAATAVIVTTSPRPVGPAPCGPGPGDIHCTPTPVVIAAGPTATPVLVPTSVPPTPPVTPTPTSAVAGVPTPAPTSGPCPAAVVGVLPDPASYGSPDFQRGYADSLAVADGKLVVRESYGYSLWRPDNLTWPAAVMDFQQRQAYRRVGDGQQTVSSVAASSDGQRFLAGWKTSEHGNVTLDRFHNPIREFTPQRALGGVGIVQTAGRYIGLALTSGGAGRLWAADITAAGPAGLGTGVPGSIGGLERSLATSGRFAVYLGVGGELVVVADGATAQVVPDARAVAVAIEDGVILIGVRDGMARVTASGIVGTVKPLSGTPSSVVLVGGVAYAWVGPTLFREGAPILTVDPSLYRDSIGSLWGTVAVTRGVGGLLLCGTTRAVFAVRACA